VTRERERERERDLLGNNVHDEGGESRAGEGAIFIRLQWILSR
jgi:hypothetical protein